MKLFAATLALVTLSTAALAQDGAFSGKCTDYRDRGAEACNATQWCRWVNSKPVALPNGKTYTPKGYCRFRRGMKEGYKQTVAAG